ncbi:MAG: serine hydrolase domain-containing protein [Dehalococcoidia bacterium]|nr:MAG: class A beta-lactamase-related serine hydrolase [Chloroflexota bacterium]
MQLSLEKLEHLSAYFNDRYVPKNLPGYSILVNQLDKNVYYYENGLIDVKGNRPLKRDSIFRIYSMTKPITSISIMMLFEQGKLNITDEVEKFIPEWSELSVYQSGSFESLITEPLKRKMTIKDLLMHRSGLTYDFEETSFVQKIYLKEEIKIARSKEKLSADEYIRKLADIPLAFSPGEFFNYSISTDILGFIIERISNMSLEEYFKKNIFEPLEMEDTFFQIPKEKINRLANCYIYDQTNDKYIVEDDFEKSSYIEKPSCYSGGGGLLSTIDDYMKFCNLLQNKGSLNNKNIIGSRTAEFMMSNHLEKDVDLYDIAKGKWGTNIGKGVGFSLGGSVILDPIKNMSLISKDSFSWGGAASTLFWVDPIEKISVVFMTQMLGNPLSQEIRADLRNLVYQALI